MKTVRVIVAIFVLALPCACSKKQADTPATASPAAAAARPAPIADPCRLLTQDEASEAAGAKLSPGETRRFGSITRCSFFNKADPSREVMLDVQNETASVPDDQLFDSYTHMPDVHAVSGIGDQALWVHNEIASGFTILKGGHMVEMKLPRSVDPLSPPAQQAAKAIASRM
jgi:hypothetical protein